MNDQEFLNSIEDEIETNPMSKKFIDTRTGKIVSQFNILSMKYMEEV